MLKGFGYTESLDSAYGFCRLPRAVPRYWIPRKDHRWERIASHRPARRRSVSPSPGYSNPGASFCASLLVNGPRHAIRPAYVDRHVKSVESRRNLELLALPSPKDQAGDSPSIGMFCHGGRLDPRVDPRPRRTDSALHADSRFGGRIVPERPATSVQAAALDGRPVYFRTSDSPGRAKGCNELLPPPTPDHIFRKCGSCPCSSPRHSSAWLNVDSTK